MNTWRNWSLHLDRAICEEEKGVTYIYLVALSMMEVLAAYLCLSLVLSMVYVHKPAPASSSQNAFYERYRKALHIFLLIVIVTLNLGLITDIIHLGLGSAAYPAFGSIFITKATFTTLSTMGVYAFLWLRQWILYNQPGLREVKTTTFKVFNILTLVLTITLVAVIPALLVRYVHLGLSEEGCIYARTSSWGKALAIHTGFSIAYETILLGFFVYPLKRAHSHGNEEVRYTVLPIVKRSLLSALTCFITGIIFAFVHNLIERPIMLNTVTTDLELLVYYISLVASYNDWMDKFFICCGVKPFENKITSASDNESSTGKKDSSRIHEDKSGTDQTTM